ncbi:MAG: Ppx/GppA phosphatase family protein [Pseudomonadota bacterium]
MPQKGFSIAGLLKLRNRDEAQGRLRARRPVAIIDIGSNSVRQVVYEGLTRAPSILFNEKVLCGLGRGLAKDGTLEEEAKQRALRAIRRFTLIARQLKVEDTHILATAAAREASNGEAFVAEVEKITGKAVSLLTGAQEAEYAAFGVRSGFHNPDGIAADLGGGSTELIGINGDMTNGVTTPLGGLRLQEEAGENLKAARKIAKNTLKQVNVKWPGASRTLYAIGGTWRSLARLYMMETAHPLDVVHGFSAAAKPFREFCDKVAEGNFDRFSHIDEISKNRKPLLPYGAVVMSELINRFDVEQVAMSSSGLREGYMYSLLDTETQSRDALLEATAELSLLRARSPRHSRELCDWTDMAFEVLGLDEDIKHRRWRLAACNLADIVWRSASDFRAEQTLGIINNAGFSAISHEGRAYLALVTYHRYQGLGPKKEPPAYTSLANENDARLARILAAFFRVLYQFSAAEEGVLPRLRMERLEKGKLDFIVPKDLIDMVGERPEQRIEHLARELDEEITIRVG